MKTTRTCPYTDKSFSPKTPEHYFFSASALDKYIESCDPLDSFEPTFRDVNWVTQTRVDPITGEEFVATHPAQKYAHQEEEAYTPRTKECLECNHLFHADKPNTRYCVECSPKGGERVTS